MRRALHIAGFFLFCERFRLALWTGQIGLVPHSCPILERGRGLFAAGDPLACVADELVEGRAVGALGAPLAELGRRVVLPPWLESRRAEIEARLTPLPDPRAGWPHPAGER